MNFHPLIWYSREPDQKALQLEIKRSGMTLKISHTFSSTFVKLLSTIENNNFHP